MKCISFYTSSHLFHSEAKKSPSGELISYFRIENSTPNDAHITLTMFSNLVITEMNVDH